MTWSEKRTEVVRAIDERRFDDAERLFEELRALTREATDPRCEADERFTEGLLRDAQGRHEDAERAFTAALDLDRRLRGDEHPAVGESLHSLAIVLSRRGDHEGALERYRAALEIFRGTRELHVSRVLASIGQELLALGRPEEALEAFEASERASNDESPRHDVARALVGQGEALRRMKQFVPALGRLARCTRLATTSMWPKLANEVGAAWLGIGILSRHALRDTQVQAAFAFWFASIVGAEATKKKALEQLETMPEHARALDGDPTELRVVYRDGDGNVHVASSVRGLRHVRSARRFELGDAVVVFEGELVRANA